MGEEADADWQAGLSEWGEEDARRWLADKMHDAMMKALTGPTRKPRQTALRARRRSFETVELDNAGNIIEPAPRCPRCGPILLCSKHAAMVG